MSDDIRRVDQGPIIVIDGDCSVELTPAHYPTPPVKVKHPRKDTRIDLIDGERVEDTDRVMPP